MVEPGVTDRIESREDVACGQPPPLKTSPINCKTKVGGGKYEFVFARYLSTEA